jgi:O-antigen/teichoic acid export membrane protein
VTTRQFNRTFATLVGGEALSRLIAFAASVLLARRLGPAAYGIIGVATGIMLYATQLADGGIELVGVSVIARNRDDVRSLGSAVLTRRFANALGLMLITIAIGLLLPVQPDGAVLAVYALGLLPTALSARWILLGLEEPAPIAWGRLLGESLALGMIIVLVHDVGALALVPVAAFAGLAVATAIMLQALARRGTPLVVASDGNLTRPVFVRARTLVGFTLLGLLLFNFDLIYLRGVKGPAAAGYYASAYMLISFAANMIVAFAHSVMPALARMDDAPTERQTVYHDAIARAFAFTLPLGVGGALVARSIVATIFGAAFLPGATALAILLIVVPLAALREIPVVALISGHRERDLFRVNAASVVINVVACVLVIPRFGLNGAAWATVGTEFVRFALAQWFAQRAGFRFISIARLLRPVVACALMATAILVFGRPTVEMGVPRLALTVAGGAMVYALSLSAMGLLALKEGRLQVRV